MFIFLNDSMRSNQPLLTGDVRKFVDDFIGSKPPSFFREGIHKLSDKWYKVQ